MLKELTSSGLSEKESKIYIYLSKKPHDTATNISKATSLDRRTTYDILNLLIKKGYVSYHKRNNTKMFTASNPEEILNDLKQKQLNLQAIIPQLLSSKRKDKTKIQVEIFEGKKGLKAIFNDILQTSKTHYAFGQLSPFLENAEFETMNFINNLKKLKHKEKLIYKKGDQIERIPNGEYKALDPNKLPPTDTIIYKNKVAMIIFKNPIIIIRITSKDIYKSYLNYFNLFWNIK